MTSIKEKLRRGINLPYMLQSMASGYRREALAEIERLEAEVNELRANLEAQKSFAETHPANPLATCKCEHWQSCAECHPTAHESKCNPTPVYSANCSRHPDAPHGFDRTASHGAGHYVCECQGWTPGDAS